MSLLSDADLAQMRATLDQSLPGTAVISTLAGTSDGGGGGSMTWHAAGTVSCRVAVISGAEADIADRLAAQVDWIVTLPAETPITAKDRVSISGIDYNVTALHAPRSYELSRRVKVAEVV